MRFVAVVETQNGTTQKIETKQSKAWKKTHKHNSDNIANKHFLFDC